MKSSKHTALLISGSLIALLFFSSITLSIALAFFNNGRIAYGIHSGSTSLSGMSQEEAANIVCSAGKELGVNEVRTRR